MPRLPDPFSTDLEQFSLLVDILHQLDSEGRIRLKSSPGSNITFIVPSLVLEERINNKIEKNVASKIINEVSTITTLRLKEQINSYFDSLINEIDRIGQINIKDEEKKEIKDILNRKLYIVESQLITDRVRQKFSQSRANKHDFLVDLRWEIVNRQYDKDLGDKARGMISLIKFDIASRSQFDFFPFLAGLEESQKKNFIIELDKDDIDELIEELNNIKLLLIKESGE